MTNLERAEATRRLHIRAMMALIEVEISAGRALNLIMVALDADVARYANTPPAGMRITIYGITAHATMGDIALLRAWLTAAANHLQSPPKPKN